jgi:thymidylate synthase ThyX
MSVEFNSNTVPVLDKGYVRLIDSMGGDLGIVNAARASYNKESDEMSEKDARLIGFLMKEGHWSPFRHSFVTFEVKADLMTTRQLQKHLVGGSFTDPFFAWNEACLTGDQTVRLGNGRVITLQELYQLYSAGEKGLAIETMKDGLVEAHEIEDIWISPEECDIFTLLTENGRSIKGTSNHRIPVIDRGDIELIEINPGDDIWVNQEGKKDRDRVIDIFPSEKRAFVYDVQMKDGDNPYFLANGILTHNSRRYITSDEEFYEIQADQWRSKPENSKQGSGELIDDFTGSFYTEAFKKWSKEGHDLYHHAMDAGICPEQARVFLPAYSLYVTFRWSCSLQALLHFLKQRQAHDSQNEIQQYAKAVHRLAQPLFPVTFTVAGI